MKTIMFIHGMFMTPLSWSEWAAHFAAAGYTVLTPAWPGRDEPVASLNAKHPDPNLGALTFSAVIAHFVAEIAKLPEKPIVIGHSMGGLIAQILLARGLVSAAVAVHSAPPAGVFVPKWSFIKGGWPLLNPFISAAKPYQMSFEGFQYAFAHTLPESVQRHAYTTFVVPDSRRLARESTTAVAKIDFTQAHAPLLLIAGEVDHLIPAALNQLNYQKYQHSTSITDYREFAGRGHFTVGQAGWEEVANFIQTWLKDKVA